MIRWDDTFAEQVAAMTDSDLLRAYQRTDGEPGNPEADALLAAIGRGRRSLADVVEHREVTSRLVQLLTEALREADRCGELPVAAYVALALDLAGETEVGVHG